MSTEKNILRSFFCVVIALLLMLTMVSFPTSAASLSLSHSAISLTKGYSTTLKVTGASSTVTWSSGDSTIASVSSAGKVVGKSVGSTYIYAEADGVTLKCYVKVVGGKLSASSKNVSLEEDEVQYVTITAKGSHGMKVSSGDKSIVKASWVTPWDGDNIKLKLTGVSAGSTTVKVYLTKYTDVYLTINVTVEGDNDGVLLTSASSTSVTVGNTSSVMVYSDASTCTYTMADTSVATVSAGTWSNNYCTLTIKGVKAGTTTLTIARTDDSSLKKTISVTVTGSASEYYTVVKTAPTKLTSTDLILRWTDSSTSTVLYMLVPYNYDTATANTAVAKNSGTYEYYTVYDVSPTKQLSTDSIVSFTTTVSSKSVTRYILTPATADVPSVNTAKAAYTGTYEYWTLYNSSPTKLTTTDIIISWAATSNYTTVTRYVLLPYGYSEDMLDALMDEDDSNGYYGVSFTSPTKKASSDIILSFYATVDGSSKLCYVLVPSDYDVAKYNDVVAAYTGTYSRWTIYTTQPTKLLSTDIIKSWTKVVDGTTTTRYVLLPYGYSEDMYSSLVSSDLATSTSSYYVVSTTYPTITASTDTVYMFYVNGSVRYMLLPESYSVVKRNDAVLAVTSTYEYYTPYSSQPSKKTDTDVILKTWDSSTSAYVYMLVPSGYTSAKVTAGMQGQTVTV